ncbi:hypothetical protein ABH944_004315 [Caballeronia udeis]|uniref:Uncharacterized protein n=1 Tax=Caballeronia udeis TaxID=1232866 RepID=A0ABW8MJL7_9BURK
MRYEIVNAAIFVGKAQLAQCLSAMKQKLAGIFRQIADSRPAFSRIASSAAASPAGKHATGFSGETYLTVISGFQEYDSYYKISKACTQFLRLTIFNSVRPPDGAAPKSPEAVHHTA